jgi:hypothetical protein
LLGPIAAAVASAGDDPHALIDKAIQAIDGAGGGRVAGEPAGAKGSALELSKAQWHEDLEYFARELVKRHANAFHHVSRERFEAEVADLERRLGSLNGDEMYVALNRLANLIGDGHTVVHIPPDRANLPLDVERFGEEYRVTKVAPGLEKALGARVVKLGETPVARARQMLLPLTPQDETEWLAEGRIEGFLTTGMVLRGAGIVQDRNTVRYTLADDTGREFAVAVHALSSGDRPKWVPAYAEPPLFRQRPGERFWYTYLPDSKTVYCNFRGYNGLGKEATGLFKLVAEQRPDKLVIDLRQNGGGDYTEGLRHLVRPIKNLPDINRKGHLFVLIGPNTFSAAMSNSAHFRAQTAAMLVGRPIGEKPNSYQESRRMTLPNSRLVVGYSVRFYKFVERGENAIRPDQEVVTSWADYKAGRDPVLEWVLKHGAM